MSINTKRLIDRLLEMGTIGAQPTGLNCLAFTQEDECVTALARQYMLEAGLSVRTDAAGNLIGRFEGTDPSLPVVMTGSHLDSVYDGGIYDGRLGVVGGIEVLQTMREQGIRTRHPIEVCVYRDEEGARFIGSFEGARIMTGNLGKDMLDSRDKDGISARTAISQCGIDPEHIHDARLPDGYAKAHLELHIEQGAVLESQNLPVGIVTGICCQLRGEFTITGESAHAGTTPMNLRKDPLCAASELILAIEAVAASQVQTVATVGSVTVLPGGSNVVPGKVVFSLDMRHQQPQQLGILLDEILKRADAICSRRGVSYQFEERARETAAKICDAALQAQIAESCRKHGIAPFYLQSGAGHNSNAFSGFCPMGMIFVRSQGGISHNPKEYSSPEDCAAGVDVLYDTILACAEAV